MLLPPANEVWGKVIFSQVFVCPQGVGFSTCITGYMTRGPASSGVLPLAGVCIQGGLHPGGVCIQGDLHRGGSWTASLPEIHEILWDTVNKWAVRILLECILVRSNFRNYVLLPMLSMLAAKVFTAAKSYFQWDSIY